MGAPYSRHNRELTQHEVEYRRDRYIVYDHGVRAAYGADLQFAKFLKSRIKTCCMELTLISKHIGVNVCACVNVSGVHMLACL